MCEMTGCTVWTVVSFVVPCALPGLLSGMRHPVYIVLFSMHVNVCPLYLFMRGFHPLFLQMNSTLFKNGFVCRHIGHLSAVENS